MNFSKMALGLAFFGILFLPAARSEDESARTLVPPPGWPCGMPDGIPQPERGAKIFEATLKIEATYDVGRTPYGLRKVRVIGGGSVAGEKLRGEVLPGGLDFELAFPNGAMEIEQLLAIRTEDGKVIFARNEGVAAAASDVRMVPDFEAPNAGDQRWLNAGRYVARRVVSADGKTVTLAVYDLSGVSADAAGRVDVIKPPGLPDQPRSPRKMAPGEKSGERLITETVTLGPAQTVGDTKGGGRNIIPITGGTLRGKITGRVLFGGADYQKLGNPFTLDARYLWQTDDGEVVIVRNGGPIDSLAPSFEARADGPLAWLNQGTYRSSGPKIGNGSVELEFFESR